MFKIIDSLMCQAVSEFGLMAAWLAAGQVPCTTESSSEGDSGYLLFSYLACFNVGIAHAAVVSAGWPCGEGDDQQRAATQEGRGQDAGAGTVMLQYCRKST